MNIRSAIEKLIHLKTPGPGLRLLLLPLTLCSHLYCCAMLVRGWLYKACLLASYGLPCRVIAVGNITVGGTGKTPTVCLLARSLQEKGFKVAVVTRGYRGAATGAPLVVSDGLRVLASSDDAGDEAVMLARKLSGISVIACPDRVAAGNLACERFGSDIVLLDDGFQHVRLRRDLDVVLVHAADPFGNGCLLPRGVLREPLAALARAGIIVLTKACAEGAAAPLAACIKNINPEASLYTASYRAASFRNACTAAITAPESLAEARVGALCSIGDPAYFLKMLSHLGMRVSDQLLYPDHHGYCNNDYAAIRAMAARVEKVVTTEKDIAKLDAGMLQLENLIIMEIEQVIEPAQRFIDDVIIRSGLR